MALRSPRTLSLAALALSGACGTYSLVRPAETLPGGRVELSAGVAASQLGEANTVLHAAVGINDDIEIMAQNEVWNTFGEVRYGVLHEKPNGISLAVGAGAGRAITLISAVGDALDADEADAGAAGVVEVAVGKRLDRVDLTVGNRTFYQFGGGFVMSSTRAAVRFAIADSFGLMLEGGGTVHAPIDALDVSLFIGEGSAGFWIGF